MKEKFEPFKELLKALREIKYAIGGKNSGTGEGNGSNIVLPKYIHGLVRDKIQNRDVENLLEIDYDGKLIDFDIKVEMGVINPDTISEEEFTNIVEFTGTHTCLYYDPSKTISNSLPVYTKEQKDVINKDCIIMDWSADITKLNDFVFMDLYDFLTRGGGTTTLNIEKGQYYIIVHPLVYNNMINPGNIGDLTPIGDNTWA